VANDIDIIVGVKDLATKALDRLYERVGALGDGSKLAIAGVSGGMSQALNSVGSGSLGNDKLAKSIEALATSMSAKLDAALQKTNSKIDAVVSKVQNAITSISNLVKKAASIATVGAAFFTLYKATTAGVSGLGSMVVGLNKTDDAARKAKEGITAGLAPYLRMAAAAGAATTLAKASAQVASSSAGIAGRASGLVRGTLAALALNEALRKTEYANLTLRAKLLATAGKAAGLALAFDAASRATLRFGMSLLGLKKKGDEASFAITKTATASSSIANAAIKVTAAPFHAVNAGATSAAAATTRLAGSIEDLPKGADSVNSLVAGFGAFASQIGGIPGLLLSIPAGIAGIAFAAYTAASKTERQLTQLTNKMAIIEAAKLDISIDDIDTAPLRKVAEESARIAKQIQTATNVQSSKLLTLATNALPKGLGTNQIGEAMKAAVGLSEVYGTSIEDGMYRARQALEGNFESFEKLIPAIATMETNEEKLAAVSRLATNGFKVMSAETLTFWGTIERVRNGFGNVLESLGNFTSLTEVASTVLRDVVGPAVEYLDSKMKGFGFDGGKVMEQATSLAATVVAAVQTIGGNWDSVFERLKIGSELFWVQLQSQAEHFVAHTMPWLAENMTGIMQHAFAAMANDVRPAIEYMVTSAMEAMGAVPEGTAEFQRKENAKKPKYKVTALTELAPRAVSQREQGLQGKLDAVDRKLGDSFNENFRKAFDTMDTMLKSQEKIAEVDLKKVAVPKKPELEKDAKDKTKAPKTSANAVLESRVLGRGASVDAERETLATLKKIEAHLLKQNGMMQKWPGGKKPSTDSALQNNANELEFIAP
jgi:hypothetical protein